MILEDGRTFSAFRCGLAWGGVWPRAPFSPAVLWLVKAKGSRSMLGEGPAAVQLAVSSVGEIQHPYPGRMDEKGFSAPAFSPPSRQQAASCPWCPRVGLPAALAVGAGPAAFSSP